MTLPPRRVVQTRHVQLRGMLLRPLLASLLLLVGITLHLLVEREVHARPIAAQLSAIVVAKNRRRRQRKGQSRAAAYARYSSDQQSEESNAQQFRKCRELAARNEHAIATDLEFADGAVSGTKRSRVGLDAMLAAAERGDFDVLYFHSLSRLARESVITMPIMKRLVHVYGVRVVTVVEGIDTMRPDWSVITTIIALMNERFIKELAANVSRGQEDTLLAGFAVGDHCFGYTTVEVEGSESTRKGRNAKPRKMYVIDVETFNWVKRIFRWFVDERRSRSWIVRKLNELGVRKDHRARRAQWTPDIVTRLLTNEKYIGIWRWGRMENVRDPETGAISQEPRDEEEVEKWTRELPHLRLVDNQTFATAGRLIAEHKNVQDRTENGEFAGSRAGSDPAHPRHLLERLFVCECGETFEVGGGYGGYMVCRGHRKFHECDVGTQLRRDLAERLLLDEIGRRILEDEHWIELVLDSLRKSWRARSARVPEELAAAEKKLADVRARLKRLLDAIEEGNEDPDVEVRLRERRFERDEVEELVERLREEAESARGEPTREWLMEQLAQLGSVLKEKTPAATHALRDLVGGKIVLQEVPLIGTNKTFLRGRFNLRVKSVVQAVGARAENAEEHTEVVVVDFREPLLIEEQSERAKELLDDGLAMFEVAEILGVSKSRLTKIVKFWYESRKLPVPDGRSRRATLEKKHREPPVYQRIADEAKRLYAEGLLVGEIAERLGRNMATVRSALVWWHESRGLEYTDGRARRKSLERKSRPRDDSHE